MPTSGKGDAWGILQKTINETKRKNPSFPSFASVSRFSFRSPPPPAGSEIGAPVWKKCGALPKRRYVFTSPGSPAARVLEFALRACRDPNFRDGNMLSLPVKRMRISKIYLNFFPAACCFSRSGSNLSIWTGMTKGLESVLARAKPTSCARMRELEKSRKS